MRPGGRCSTKRWQIPGNKGWSLFSSSSAGLRSSSWSPGESTVGDHKFFVSVFFFFLNQREPAHSSIQLTTGCRERERLSGGKSSFNAWPQEWRITSSQSFQPTPAGCSPQDKHHCTYKTVHAPPRTCLQRNTSGSRYARKRRHLEINSTQAKLRV